MSGEIGSRICPGRVLVSTGRFQERELRYADLDGVEICPGLDSRMSQHLCLIEILNPVSWSVGFRISRGLTYATSLALAPALLTTPDIVDLLRTIWEFVMRDMEVESF